MAILRKGWGYWEEYIGSIKGNFRRTPEDMPGVMIEEIGYGGYPDDVLITLPNGKRGMAKLQALVPGLRKHTKTYTTSRCRMASNDLRE